MLYFMISVHVDSIFYIYTSYCITENIKQIFPKKKLRGLSPNFHIHVSVSNLHISTIRSACSAAGKDVDRSREYVNRSQTHELWEIRTEAAKILFWEYKNGISLQCTGRLVTLLKEFLAKENEIMALHIFFCLKETVASAHL
jgi:hypothetical protein